MKVITGTGRAGTTLLMKILTEMGLDTGFDSNTPVDKTSKGGLERNALNSNHEIVKDPFFCDYAKEALFKKGISGIIVPIRQLSKAAESRRRISRMRGKNAPGALFGTNDPNNQEFVLLEKIYNLLFEMSMYDIPLTLIRFPDFAYDIDYCKFKLLEAGLISYEPEDIFKFEKAFKKIVKPEYINL